MVPPGSGYTHTQSQSMNLGSPAVPTVVLTANCNYAYKGHDAIVDCFFQFPKAYSYKFYFDARW